MGQRILFQTLESGVYIFGCHLETVPARWQYRSDKHDLFELLYVMDGHQKTVLENQSPIICGPGEAIIIAPGTVHKNFNNSENDKMSYFCFHFTVESLAIKAKLIRNIVNTKIESETEIARASQKVAEQMISYKNDCQISDEERKIKNEIVFLEFVLVLIRDNVIYKENPAFTVREAQVARDIANLIENDYSDIRYEDEKVKKPTSFGEICCALSISTGYGHRVFKKVYGITPLKLSSEYRCQRAKRLLGVSEYSIEDIAYLLSFRSLASFSKQFKRWTGLTPSNYQKKLKIDRHEANYLL